MVSKAKCLVTFVTALSAISRGATYMRPIFFFFLNNQISLVLIFKKSRLIKIYVELSQLYFNKLYLLTKGIKCHIC